MVVFIGRLKSRYCFFGHESVAAFLLSFRSLFSSHSLCSQFVGLWCCESSSFHEEVKEFLLKCIKEAILLALVGLLALAIFIARLSFPLWGNFLGGLVQLSVLVLWYIFGRVFGIPAFVGILPFLWAIQQI